MPLLLGAFALRAFVPGGMAIGATMSLESPMCATQSGRVEILEIPVGVAEAHCEQCFAPPVGAPFASLAIGIAPAPHHPLLPHGASQPGKSPLVRAQTARAPPLP
jgi:hypothetical protein